MRACSEPSAGERAAQQREQAERAKAAAKLAALGGTQLGNIMGVKDEEAEAIGTLCPFPSLL